MRSTGKVNRTKTEKSPWEYKYLKGQTEGRTPFGKEYKKRGQRQWSSRGEISLNPRERTFSKGELRCVLGGVK